MRAHCLLFLLVTFIVAADEPKGNSAKKDMDKLQGYWRVSNVAQVGTLGPDKDVRNLRLVFTEKILSFEWVGKATYDAKYRLDPTKKPKTIDITFITGPDEGKTFRGIYELEGKTLKLCYSRSESKRPTKLSSKPEAECLLLVLKQTKP